MRPTTLLKSILLALAIAAAGVAVVNADEPIPAVMPSLVADKAVTGTGKRSDPFTFDATTKCVLRLMGTAAEVRWTMDDAPPDIEVIGNALVFSLASPGEYVVFGSWSDGAVVAWLRIKGPNGPPEPINRLAADLRAALTGPDAAKDAVQFAAIVRGIADQAEASPPATHKQLRALMTSMQTSLQWPAGKYPKLPDLWRSVIPTEPDDAKAITATELSAIVASIRVLEKTAGIIAGGK